MISFAELVDGIDDITIEGDSTVEINKVEVDSRLVVENDLYIAVPGYTVDGLNFVNEVVDKKVAAIIASKPFDADVACKGIVTEIRSAIAKIAAKYYNYPSRRFRLIGITGTNGKTTITYLLKSILQRRLIPVGLIGTLGYQTGAHSFEAINTTPGPIELQRLFTLMANEKLRYVVMEVSSHALTMKRVEESTFQVVAVSNVTHDHLDFHNSFEDYLATKAHLIELVEGEDKWVVLNMDDPNYDYLLKRVNSSHLSFSLSNAKADLTLEDVEIGADGSRFTLVTPLGKEQVDYQLLGQFNLENALCAAACAMAVGLDPLNIAAGLSSCSYIVGRAQKINAGQPYTILIDFAHTPDALTRILTSAREMCKGRLITLFGCGGDRDRAKRPLMGKIASSLSDVVVVTSDNPRSEDPAAIIEEIKPGLDKSKLTIIEPDRKRAIITALELCQETDLLVVAGKGHEDYQIIGDTIVHLDDREIIEHHLKEKQ